MNKYREPVQTKTVVIKGQEVTVRVFMPDPRLLQNSLRRKANPSVPEIWEIANGQPYGR